MGDPSQWKCPFCLALLDSREVLRSLPPLMERVSIQDEASRPPIADTAEFALGPVDDFQDESFQEDSGQETVAMTPEDLEAMATLEPDEEGEIPDEYQLDEAPEPVAGAAPMMDVSNIRSRKRKKKNSGWKSILGMIGGGLIAVPLAGGILLAISILTGRQFDFGFYPFDGSFGEPNVRVTASTPTPMSTGSQPASGPGRETPPPTGKSLAMDLAPLDDDSVPDPTQSALAEIVGDGSDLEEARRSEDDATQIFPEADSSAESASLTSSESEMVLPPVDAPEAPLAAIEPELMIQGENEAAANPMAEIENEPILEPAASSGLMVVGEETTTVDVETQPISLENPKPVEVPGDPLFTAQFEEVVDVMRRYHELPESDERRPKALNYAFSQLSKLAAHPEAEKDAKLGQLLQGIATEGTLLQKFAPLTPAWISEQVTGNEETGVLVVGKIIEQGGEQRVQVAGRKSYPVHVSEGLRVPDNVFVGLGRVRSQKATQVIDLVRIETR
ncbi:MAG: hypothetical protein AAGD07_16055 [Planctomycetota bacterium]